MNARISDPSSRLPLLALLLAAAAVVSLEFGRAVQDDWRAFPSPIQREPPNQLTRFSLLAAMGDEARVASDWAYIDCLQYLGDPRNEAEGRFGRTLSLYREVLWLDPSFGHAGREGVAVLGWFLHRPKEAGSLIGSARAWNPSDHRYGAYLAALGYKRRLDPHGVVEALRPEIMRPDAPDMLLRMVGNIYLKEKDWAGAQAYWRWIQVRSKNPMTQSMARRALAAAAAGLAQQTGH